MPEKQQLKELKELRNRIDNSMDRIRQIQFSDWRKLLGSQLDEAISCAKTINLLSDVNPAIREGALCLLASYWPPSLELDSMLRDFALRDPDSKVRGSAVLCLKGLHKGSHDTDIAQLMASIVKNTANPCHLRGIAYVALLAIQGTGASFELYSALHQSKHSLPDNLDWSMVDSFI